MGIIVTLLFVAIAYLTPLTVFGEVGVAYHPLVLIGWIALILTAFKLPGSEAASLPQSWACLGLTISMTISLVLVGWMGGVVFGIVDEYLPHMLVFFFVLVNFRTKRHLYLLIGTIFPVMAFIIVHGAVATMTNDESSLYVLMARDGVGGFFTRIHGLGFINDPNDFSQVLVALIPMMFIFWKKGSTVRNIFLVYLPVSWLLFGMFMTHSRGALLAIVACAAVTLRRKIGILPSVIGGGIIFTAFSALGWTGGRDVSAGSDRLAAWAKGIELFVHHPLFGIGLRRFTEYYDITAHNSVVVTAAEAGFIGLFFWVLFYGTTLYDAYRGAKDPEKEKIKTTDDDLPIYARQRVALAASGPELPVQRVAVGGWSGRGGREQNSSAVAAAEKQPDADSLPFHLRAKEFAGATVDMDATEVHRLCEIMLLSFTGFFTCGWFLSRAYEMTLYLNAAIVAVIYRMGRHAGVLPPPVPMGQAVKYSLITSVCLLVIVWVMLHLSLLTKH